MGQEFFFRQAKHKNMVKLPPEVWRREVYFLSTVATLGILGTEVGVGPFKEIADGFCHVFFFEFGNFF